VAFRDDVVVNVAPEYADCAGAARALGMPLKEVYRAALAEVAAML
jgi:pyridinium-3,5-bisthiocarboxylic acid mononucleotide nickel chelatase